MTLGEELQAARRAAGLTQEQLAARVRMDRTHISDIENDKFSPSVSTLVRLCEGIGVRASVILARVEGEATATAEEQTASD